VWSLRGAAPVLQIQAFCADPGVSSGSRGSSDCSPSAASRALIRAKRGSRLVSVIVIGTVFVSRLGLARRGPSPRWIAESLLATLVYLFLRPCAAGVHADVWPNPARVVLAVATGVSLCLRSLSRGRVMLVLSCAVFVAGLVLTARRSPPDLMVALPAGVQKQFAVGRRR